jgi:glycosyltransferase involved in cell wall biosynthesis
MRILLVTDAWPPQINGVAHTLSYITDLIRREHDITVLNPYVEGSETLPILIHNIPVVTNAADLADRYLGACLPDRVHIATEGPLGFAVRQLCRKNRISYNTSYHTRIADYGWLLYKVPAFMTWAYIRWFHMCSRKVLVTTRSITRELGLSNCMVWGRGVDAELFYPEPETKPRGERTIITVGRVSRDKNLDDFCRIRGYKKILVGGGPYLAALRAKYPDVEFTGLVPHGELRRMYARADVFVFPSRLDTFGLVILEAMACGLPVAAYDVPSPSDIVRNGATGYLGDNLEENIENAFGNLDYVSAGALAYARSQSWDSIAEQFVNHLA